MKLLVLLFGLLSAAHSSTMHFDVVLSDLIDGIDTTDFSNTSSKIDIILYKSHHGKITINLTHKSDTNQIPLRTVRNFEILEWYPETLENNDKDLLIRGITEVGNIFTGRINTINMELHIIEFRGNRLVFYDSF